MKRLIVTLEYPPDVGGIASYTFNLAAHLPAEDVVVYAPKANDASVDQKVPWKTYRRQPYSTFFWPRWVRLFLQLRKIIQTEKIEEVFVQQVLPVGYTAYMIKRFLRVPYTIFLHGTDLEFANRTPWKRRMFTQICRGARRVVVNSEFLKNKLRSRLGDLSSVEVLNPPPADYFFEAVLEEKKHELKAQLALEGKQVILTVGRMVEGKGYPHLLRLLPKIAQAVPNTVLVMIGDGPKLPQLVDFVQKNYLHNVVRFLGSIPNESLPAYYQLADIFTLLTHPDEMTEEGWGTVFLEAAASGIPAVAGRAGGVEEAVSHLETGIVVDVHQEKAVVSAITELLKNPTYAKEMGERAKERVRREFSWERQVEKLEIDNKK